MSQLSETQVTLLVSALAFLMMLLVGGIIRITLEKRKRKRKQLLGAWDFKELAKHEGHKIVVVTYAGKGKKPQNAAVECETCHVVLMDYTKGDKVFVLSKEGCREGLEERLEREPTKSELEDFWAYLEGDIGQWINDNEKAWIRDRKSK